MLEVNESKLVLKGQKEVNDLEVIKEKQTKKTKCTSHNVKMYRTSVGEREDEKIFTTLKMTTHRKKRNLREKNCRLRKTLGNTISHSRTTTAVADKTVTNMKASTSPLTTTTIAMKATKNNHKRRKHISWSWMYSVFFLALVQSKNVAYTLEAKSQIGLMATTSTTSMASTKYSQPLMAENNNDNSFRPIIPKDINLEYISQNVFNKIGQYRVFEPIDSDLRATVSQRQETISTKPSTATPNVMTLQSKKKAIEEITHASGSLQTKTTKEKEVIEVGSDKDADFQTHQLRIHVNSKAKTLNDFNRNTISASADATDAMSKQIRPPINGTMQPAIDFQATLASEIKGLEGLLTEYVDNFFNKGQYQPRPELIMALQQNITKMKQQYKRNIEPHLPEEPKSSTRIVRHAVTKRTSGDLSLNIPRAFESGRLLFFAGLKKVMWPIYMGLQILKSLMFALLLPTLIGSFGKLIGKGITSGSAPLFIRPLDEPQDLDFKDNNFNFDDESNKFGLMDDTSHGGGLKDNGYAYNQAEASQTHNQYAYNGAAINQQTFSRYGMNERQQLMQDSYFSALQSLGAASFKNSNGLSGGSSGGLAAPTRQKPAAIANTNTFQQFQKVPASSLLLSNYDPFYSPLLSRLDSVFAQLKLNSDDEACREKLICLMYANPAKYAPYSNLVSAQLSRELNELRKPTSDNPDILRFFKYMRAAKDGQDGIECEKSFDKCKEFKDFENPAMVSTYHDINKLVQARKFT